MKTGRHDYDIAFNGGNSSIPDEEPVFVIRGQDKAAPETLRAYAKLALNWGASGELVGAVLIHADAMEAWQMAHGGKTPTLP